MSQEIKRDPPPRETEVQKVEVFPNGFGWKSVIKCPEQDCGCNSDYQFSSPGGGINHRRMMDIRRKMGI